MSTSIHVKDLEKYLNDLLQVSLFDEAAYNGVQIATHVPIKKVATAVSVTKEVIQQAIAMQANALIVHHGIFRKHDKHPLIGSVYEYVRLLMQHNIALLCYHLPLDAHQDVGNNWKAASDLGLTDCQPCVKFGRMDIGVMGDVNNHSFDEFQKKVEKYYGRSAAVVKVHDHVHKVAIISGAGDKCIQDVAVLGADCLITGRVDEAVWQDAHEYGVSFLGLGHYGTEVVGVKALAEHLRNHFSIPVEFIKTDNPF